MAESQAYRRWLASGETERQVVETFQIEHASFETTFVVNADRDFRAKLEDGNYYTFNRGRFYADPAEVNEGTEQSMTVAFAQGDGKIYEKIRQMSFDDRQTPITAIYRLFFLDDPDNMLITPAPRWSVHALEATREAIKADLRAPHMRVQRIGRYYTAHEFPALRLI